MSTSTPTRQSSLGSAPPSFERIGKSFRIALEALVKAHIADIHHHGCDQAYAMARYRTLGEPSAQQRLQPVSWPRTPRTDEQRNDLDFDGLSRIPKTPRGDFDDVEEEHGRTWTAIEVDASIGTPRTPPAERSASVSVHHAAKAHHFKMSEEQRDLFMHAYSHSHGHDHQADHGHHDHQADHGHGHDHRQVHVAETEAAIVESSAECSGNGNKKTDDDDDDGDGNGLQKMEETNIKETRKARNRGSILNVWEEGTQKDALMSEASNMSDKLSHEHDMQKLAPIFETILRGEQTVGAKRELLARLVTHPRFDGLFAILIAMNTIAIALEVQYHGVDIGHGLDYPGYNETAAEYWPGMEHVFKILEKVFGIVFTAEVALKMLGLRKQFVKSLWNAFDSFVIIFWVLGQFIEAKIVLNPMLLRLVRLARLMRLVRLVRWIQALDALHILIRSIEASLSVLVWASVLIFTMIVLMAMVVHHLSVGYMEDDSKPLPGRKDVFRYFGTFTRSCISFFEATLGNFAPIMRSLTDNVDENWGFFFMLYKCVGGFAVISVISGVFLHETFRVANTDPDLMVIKERRQKKKHAEQMNRLFAAADSDGHGYLNYSDFSKLMDDKFIREWLSSCELNVHDVRLLFHLMDDGDGTLTADEFMKGVSRLKGQARSIDLQAMMMASIDLHALLMDIHGLVESIDEATLPSLQGAMNTLRSSLSNDRVHGS